MYFLPDDVIALVCADGDVVELRERRHRNRLDTVDHPGTDHMSADRVRNRGCLQRDLVPDGRIVRLDDVTEEGPTPDCVVSSIASPTRS